MVFAAIVFCLLFILVSCKQSSIKDQDDVHWDLSGMIYVGNHLYISVQNISDDSDNYSTILSELELIGVVEKKFQQYEVPNTEFSSNCLAVGTEIYIRGNDEMILYHKEKGTLYPYERDDLFAKNNPT